MTGRGVPQPSVGSSEALLPGLWGELGARPDNPLGTCMQFATSMRLPPLPSFTETVRVSTYRGTVASGFADLDLRMARER
jgi:hypothetical protein